MRARLPDESGYVVNSGVRIHYEVHGAGQPAILLLPTWAIVDSRHWKMQVPFLARDHRVITFDPRGNGRSDLPLPRGSNVITRWSLARNGTCIFQCLESTIAHVGSSMMAG